MGATEIEERVVPLGQLAQPAHDPLGAAVPVEGHVDQDGGRVGHGVEQNAVVVGTDQAGDVHAEISVVDEEAYNYFPSLY